MKMLSRLFFYVFHFMLLNCDENGLVYFDDCCGINRAMRPANSAMFWVCK